MRKVVFAALLASLAASASAFIPPTYSIAVVAKQRSDLALGHALVEYMAAEQAFFRARNSGFESAARACLSKDEVEQCIHNEIARLQSDPRTASLVVVATSVGNGRQRWQCIGSGKRPAIAKSMNVVVDLQAAMFGSEQERVRNLRAAMDCIQAAANESSAQ